MSRTTDLLLRHPMGERAWQAGLVVELVDPVSGALVHRGLALRAIPAGGGAPLAPRAVTASGRFAFRGIAPGQEVLLVVEPEEAPFLPERLALPPAADPAQPVRQARLVLVPHRGYPFAAGDCVLHHRLVAEGAPVAGALVAPEEGAGLLAAPARTDRDGEFVLYLRPGNGRARPFPAARLHL